MMTIEDFHESTNGEAKLKAAVGYIVGAAGFLLSELPTVHRQALWSALVRHPVFRAFEDEMAEHVATLALRHVHTAMLLDAREKRARPSARPAAKRRKAVSR